MDRVDLESGHRLHQNHAWLRSLLCRAILQEYPGSSSVARAARRLGPCGLSGSVTSGTDAHGRKYPSSSSSGAGGLRRQADASSKGSSTTPCLFIRRRAETMSFRWHPDEPPPLIEEHSKAARDVMIQRHWEIRNTFEHYGSGDFGMLGWDALKNSDQLPLFNFEELEAVRTREQLLNSMPRQLFSLASESPVTVDAMRHAFANETAARFSDLDQVVLQLAKEREIDILSPDGNVRSRTLIRLQPTDRITFPATLLLPGISRLR